MVAFITALQYCAASQLTGVQAFPPSSVAIVSGLPDLKDLPIAGLASLEVSEETQDGQRIFTSKLTATLCGTFDAPTAPIALLATLTDGTRMLLGTSSRPFPLTTITTKRPDKASEQSAQTLTCTWTAPTPALEVE